MKKNLLSIILVLGGLHLASAQNEPAPAPQPVPVPAPGDNGTPVPPMPLPASMPAPTAQTEPTVNSNAKIEFVKTSHQFGNVIEGPEARVDFVFTNTGTEPLKLSNVQASCGCTTPKWPKGEILPGKSDTITAIYGTQGRPGSFTKTIMVYSNATAQPVTLTISGTVVTEPVKPKSPIIIKQ